jgi:hypothetical protein
MKRHHERIGQAPAGADAKKRGLLGLPPRERWQELAFVGDVERIEAEQFTRDAAGRLTGSVFCQFFCD